MKCKTDKIRAAWAAGHTGISTDPLTAHSKSSFSKPSSPLSSALGRPLVYNVCHPKKSRGLLREGIDVKFRFHCEAPGDLAGAMVVRGARCLAGWVLCLADTTARSAQPE
jgi:hypothetical protein